MLLLTIALLFTRDPIRRAALIRQRNIIRRSHGRHVIHFGAAYYLTRSFHSGHTRHSGSVGTSGNYTAAGNPRTGNRRGPRKGY